MHILSGGQNDVHTSTSTKKEILQKKTKDHPRYEKDQELQ
jgi:hypothetical protein